jgi:thiamine-phosphate pyrophosphorylase
VIVLITDPRKSDEELAQIAGEASRAIPKGKLAIMLRDKARDDDGVLSLATKLNEIAHAHGHVFLVQDNHHRIAFEVGADGVHVTASKPKGAAYREGASERVIVSMPAHSDDDVKHAHQNRIDWVLVSPIFATPNKGEPRGVSAIRNAAEIKGDHERLNVIALGGVDASNAGSCIEAGADGVAVIRAILDAADPFEASRALWNAVITSKSR